MRKLKGLLVCLLAIGMLAGCSKDDAPKKTVCTGVIDGNEEKLTFEGEGDKLIKMSEEAMIPLSVYGISAEDYANDNSILDLELLKKYVMESMVGAAEMKGITIDLVVKDDNLVLNMDMDYTKADLDALVKSGFVESGAIKTNSLSYKESIKAYQNANGMKCTEE